jgi:hypothetical protein
MKAREDNAQRRSGAVSAPAERAAASVSGRRAKILEDTRRTVLQSLRGFPCAVYLFGSFARNEERASSDIDVGIDAPVAAPPGMIPELRRILEESAIPYRVDVVELREAKKDFRDRVRREGVQ